MFEILAPTYNAVVRLASGAFRSSPVTSIHSESGCLPFDMLVIQRIAQLVIRLSEKLNEANFMSFARISTLYYDTTGCTIPTISKLRRCIDREWNFKEPQIDDRIKQRLKAGTCRHKVVPTLKAFIYDKYHDYNIIYTDGSKTNDGTGAALVDGETVMEFPLPGSCSIFSAEAYALKKAVAESLPDGKNLILSDSASCLDALKRGRSKHPWIQEIEKLIQTRNVVFAWIPGHSGIFGNDKADFHANEARKIPPQNIPLPSQDAVFEIRRQIWNKWTTTWWQSRCFLRINKPYPTKYVDRKCASEQRVLTRLRIGHTRFTHSYLFERNSPPTCSFCGVIRTVEHILIDCKGYEEPRKKYNITGTIYEVLANDADKENNLIKFLKEGKLFELI